MTAAVEKQDDGKLSNSHAESITETPCNRCKRSSEDEMESRREGVTSGLSKILTIFRSSKVRSILLSVILYISDGEIFVVLVDNLGLQSLYLSPWCWTDDVARQTKR